MDILLSPSQCKRLVQLQLPQPKDANLLQVYFLDEDNLALYEATKYSDQYRSWFVDNMFCKDGVFNILTKVDPIYIFIPQLMRFASEQFRSLHDICTSFDDNSIDGASKLQHALIPDINWSHVCDTKDLDNELYLKFNESKTLDWLMRKHSKVVESLKCALEVQASRATLNSYASDLIDQYLPTSVGNKFKNSVKSHNLAIPDDKIEKDIPITKKNTSVKANDTPRNSSKRFSEPTKSASPQMGIMRFMKRKAD